MSFQTFGESITLNDKQRIFFDKQLQIIEIKDHRYVIYNGLRLILLLNTMGGLTFWASGFSSQMAVAQILWGAGAVFSFIALLYFIFRKTALNRIPLRSIQSLKKRNFLGIKTYSFVLKNGKERSLPALRSKKELRMLEHLIYDVELKMTSADTKMTS